MAARGESLRDRQIASLKKMLNLNETVDAADENDAQAQALLAPVGPLLDTDGNPTWKILVFDDLGRDVVSSVLRVSDLRSMGVTMHKHIRSNRQAIPDVPVIYLVEPNESNLKSITTDLRKGLYNPAHINFLSSLPRVLLEDFAAQTAEAGTSERIAQIFDQYLNYIVTEPDLFSLGMQKDHTYWALNSATTTDEELDKVIDKAVSGLFSVVVTMGTIPIIRCPKDAAAEMVAQRLDRKLRDHILNSKENLFSNARQPAGSTPASRPVLILLDRNIDLTPMLSHPWTYQCLVHDVLKRGLDLGADDFFWSKYAGAPVVAAADALDAELLKWKEESQSMTKGVDTQLNRMVEGVATMRDRKVIIDKHMNMLTEIFNVIQARGLDQFASLESDVLRLTKDEVLKKLAASDEGNDPTDKLRLFIIWFLSTETELSRAEYDEFTKVLETANSNVTCLPYIRQVRATTKMTQLSTINKQTNPQAPRSNLLGRFSNFTSRLKETGVPSSLTSNLESIISGVKNFMPVDKDLTATKIVESIMDPSTASSSAIAKTENYLYFDPRSANARGTMPPPSVVRSGARTNTPGGLPGSSQGPGQSASFGQRRQGFSEAVVFTVGGGSMEEYGNLQEWVTRTGGEKARKRIVYGSTEIINANEFITEGLERLGKEVAS